MRCNSAAPPTMPRRVSVAVPTVNDATNSENPRRAAMPMHVFSTTAKQSTQMSRYVCDERQHTCKSAVGAVRVQCERKRGHARTEGRELGQVAMRTSRATPVCSC